MKPLLTALLMSVLCDYAMAGLMGSTQSVAVIGRLFCKGNYTEKHWRVQLYDRDLTDFDDLMAETVSRDHGSFYLQGHEEEITAIDPEIRIRHDCGGKIQCFKIEIPDEFINKGKYPDRIFDVGTVPLEKTPANCNL